MKVGKAHAQPLLWFRVFDEIRNDELPSRVCEGHFAANIVAAFVAAFGKDQEQCHASLDGLGNFVVVGMTGAGIARRDPARHAASLEIAYNTEGYIAIFAHMADKKKLVGGAIRANGGRLDRLMQPWLRHRGPQALRMRRRRSSEFSIPARSSQG
jgi:hypothetical protein